MSFITSSEFANRYDIPLNPDQVGVITEYINRVENEYLPMLLGVELYELFLADYNATVTGSFVDARFQFIHDSFTHQDNGCFVMSHGIKDMLLGFTYFLYIRDRVTRIETVGIARIDGDTSHSVTALQHDIHSRYNDAVITFGAIQDYICFVAPEDYPEYCGITIEITNPF